MLRCSQIKLGNSSVTARADCSRWRWAESFGHESRFWFVGRSAAFSFSMDVRSHVFNFALRWRASDKRVALAVRLVIATFGGEAARNGPRDANNSRICAGVRSTETYLFAF